MQDTCYNDNNVFAKIIRGEVPCKKVYEDEFILSFHDINPEAPIHILVIPKKQYISYDDFMESAPENILHLFRIIKKIAHQYDLHKTGYKLITNHGKKSGQIIPHFHVHLLGYK
ncbi:HIT domain-containing protein [Neoehrlichia mikurensis]|uniref:HIT domain-containing protein n=1 Tax=Neoehrlichia mikurensis TaxID=89586 RepID=A0A9Q9F3R0_9RICK|nr:HIT domain-containing protein [Neoehrlichia mikurensis]QXK92099.1 HIT domain-containing protein [Neoehrlichia mikurensis]QXK92556.1 HIT domain-containing protein [Neoehrlichia mikurensis]QXK93792.1 HIT domain-containing protein [Neoehrlichia mikurensis]UTO55233.1 HIT domain-containing protein [Neoehrlichia mikurensis]UTO56153.1 HIT domain-containing protein [Neoehrlichia mikurensis]